MRSTAQRLGIALTTICFASACTTNPFTGERQISKTAAGVTIGAATGAAIGALAGRNRARAALIGAGAGALAGGAVGGYMDYQEHKLREQLRGSGVSVTRTGDEITLNMPGNLTFQTDSADIRADFYDVLNSIVLVLREYDKTLIEVMGHADSTGSMEYNRRLSERRADSVAAYLVAQKVDSRRVLTQGFGESYPIASNATAAGRQENRRVELRLVPITG
jgi:outer membrane protein OmpA-like peptidoglycan-associated protein